MPGTASAWKVDVMADEIATSEYDDSTTTFSIVLEEDSELLPEEQTLMARIPLMAGSNKKVAYLAYRSCGFTVGQAAELAGTTHQNVVSWRKTDKTFKKFESEELSRLQSTVGIDVIKFEMMRNMRLLLRSDFNIIAKSINGLEDMSPREYELFKNLRRFYTPTELLTMEKILEPEKHQSNQVTFQLTWGTRVQTGNVIEGTARELTESTEDSEMY
jgi:hypothetical protein